MNYIENWNCQELYNMSTSCIHSPISLNLYRLTIKYPFNLFNKVFTNNRQVINKENDVTLIKDWNIRRPRKLVKFIYKTFDAWAHLKLAELFYSTRLIKSFIGCIDYHCSEMSIYSSTGTFSKWNFPLTWHIVPT